MKNIFLAVTWN